ncbi:MAG: hypothetical protein ABI877_18195, partial [Gemmatimonadaceae bacterium]
MSALIRERHHICWLGVEVLIQRVRRFGVVAAGLLLGACADSMSPLPARAPAAALGREDAGIAAFTPQDLGFLPGDINSTGWAINTTGDVAGEGSDGTALHAIVWH